jgi:integrase
MSISLELPDVLLDALARRVAAITEQQPARQWFNAEQAADYLGTTRDAVTAMVKRGQLEPTRRKPLEETVPSHPRPNTTCQHPRKRVDKRKWEKVDEKKCGTRLTHQIGTDKYRSKVSDGLGGESSLTASFKSDTEAIKWHEKRRVQADEGDLPQTSQWTWDDLFADFADGFEGLVANGERAATTLERYRIQYRKHFSPSVGSKRVQKSAEGIGSRFLASWRKNPEISDVTSLYQLLSVLCNHAVEKKVLKESPLKAVPKRERPSQLPKDDSRVVTDEESSALIAATPDAHKPLMIVLAFCGPRISEALGLWWSNLDLADGIMTIEKQLARKKRGEPHRRVPLKTARRKGGDRREVDLLPVVVSALKRHKANAFARGLAGHNDWVFTTSLGTPMHYKDFLDRVFNPAADKAGLNRQGLPKLTPHDLRHTAISRWIAAGLDPVEVARQAGDTVETIMNVYAKEWDRVRRSKTIRDQIEAGTRISLGGAS